MSIAQSEPLFARVIGLNARLGLALGLSLALVTLDAKQHWLDALRGTLSVVSAPAQTLLSQPFTALGEAFGFMTTHGAVVEERRRLQDQVAALQATQLGYAALQAENAQLRAQMALPPRAGYTPMSAEVMALPGGAFSRRLILNLGAVAGVKPGAPVIDTYGVVGQVTRVDAQSSEVTTVISRQLLLPLQSERTSLRLLARGVGSDRLLEVSQVDRHAGLQVGDVLLTSGLDGIYPAGVPVARIIEIRPPEGGSPFARALAEPLSWVGHARPLLILNPHNSVVVP